MVFVYYNVIVMTEVYDSHYWAREGNEHFRLLDDETPRSHLSSIKESENVDCPHSLPQVQQ